jgi:tripartite-type tricarboxylate transporter receptor subunit TctC
MDRLSCRPRRAALIAACAIAILVAASAPPARAATVAEFYKGKTVTVIIGYSAGGGYDAYARVLARSMGKHIPGNPTVVPQNMPGAGSLKAALYLDKVAPKDGTYFGTIGRSEAVAPLMEEDAKFDGTKFSWLGSVTDDNSICLSWHTSKIKSWHDMMTSEFTVAGEGAGADPDIFTMAIKNLFGAKMKLVTGYPGTNDMGLAIERGEVDGACGLSWRSVESQHPDWIRQKQINVLVQIAMTKEPTLPDVPIITDFVSNPEQLQIIKLIVASQAMARPFFAPPGIPEDRKAALRTAFDETMTDPEFIADAEKAALAINPLSGAAIDALLGELYATPKEVAAKAALAIAN